jgi:hypothetical protein
MLADLSEKCQIIFDWNRIFAQQNPITIKINQMLFEIICLFTLGYPKIQIDLNDQLIELNKYWNFHVDRRCLMCKLEETWWKYLHSAEFLSIVLCARIFLASLSSTQHQIDNEYWWRERPEYRNEVVGNSALSVVVRERWYIGHRTANNVYMTKRAREIATAGKS